MAGYIVTMDTTIQVSKNLLQRLAMMKMHEKESYENIIWDLIEDRLEFSPETKLNIAKSEKEIKERKTTSLEAIRKKLGV
ncbi:MAG: hypothetical protein NT076_05445 [Candidatus Pacearchaeota archaeon]|nr:hypothetical protein [Candidatus Pacearchaeota archaeon]